jgi:hypothetical protein
LPTRDRRINRTAAALDTRREVAAYFNDNKPLLPFEKYRRRRVIFRPVGWRIGETSLPEKDSLGVK